VQPATGINIGVSYPDFLNLFKIEESLAIGHGMQGHDPDQGFICGFLNLVV
jgi:hypothetical protein